MSSPRVIKETKPRIEGKYVNIKNILKFNSIIAVKDYQNVMSELLKNNYLRSKTLNYLPDTNNILPYLELKDVIILYYLYSDQIIGTITLRPIDCILKGVIIPLQYVDFLCVHKEHRKKGIAQKLIGTLYYYQRTTSDYKVSLFKNEGKQRAIIPLTIYESNRIKLKGVPKVILHPEYKFIKITNKNIHKLYDIFNSIKQDVDYYISTNLNNMMILINTDNIELYALYYKENIMSLYYVRNSACYNEYNKEVKEIYCTYKTPLCSIEYFQNGFLLLLHKLQIEYAECIIESIGHTVKLMRWLELTGYIESKDSYLVGYYLYNYIHKTVNSEDLFINI
tara:strand:+ start:3132 stop:4142 length:1011 start_codon:yes stop_codon:yes gene_type:complete